MNATVEDLRPTIVPKSDQLNAEQLLGGELTITVTDVRVGNDEQPIIIHYANEAGRPFKPCKTMRKLLIHAWGADGRQWHGRSMTLYNDTSVKFGGDEVGGIRISHLTNIDRDIKISLTATRGKKAKYEVKRLSSELGEQLSDIAKAPTLDALKTEYESAYKSFKGASERQQLTAAKDKRKAELSAPAVPFVAAKTLAQYKADIESATSAETAALVLDASRDDLDATDQAELAVVYRNRWEDAA